MSGVQPTEDYQRDDIYYCECCGEFHDTETDKRIDVPLHELPADFALLVMEHRQSIGNRKHKTVVKRRKQKEQKRNGFGRQS